MVEQQVRTIVVPDKLVLVTRLSEKLTDKAAKNIWITDLLLDTLARPEPCVFLFFNAGYTQCLYSPGSN